jgi:hypothetical protein
MINETPVYDLNSRWTLMILHKSKQDLLNLTTLSHYYYKFFPEL